MHTVKSFEVRTCFWLTSPDFILLLYSSKYLLYQDDNNKMVAGDTFMWFKKWILLNSCIFQSYFEVIFDFILMNGSVPNVNKEEDDLPIHLIVPTVNL